MDDLQEKLNAVLSDPETMQKIMSLAGQMGQQSKEEAAVPALGGIDPAMLQKISAMASQGSIDKNQQGLLRALSPYLSAGRIAKLERAMRAARMAGMATNLMGQGR